MGYGYRVSELERQDVKATCNSQPSNLLTFSCNPLFRLDAARKYQSGRDRIRKMAPEYVQVYEGSSANYVPKGEASLLEDSTWSR